MSHLELHPLPYFSCELYNISTILFVLNKHIENIRSVISTYTNLFSELYNIYTILFFIPNFYQISDFNLHQIVL